LRIGGVRHTGEKPAQSSGHLAGPSLGELGHRAGERAVDRVLEQFEPSLVVLPP